MAAPAGHPPRLLILLAEHDPYAAELQEYFLKTEGFEVDVALGDEAARQSFLDNSPSLVVVELLISGGVRVQPVPLFQTGPRLAGRRGLGAGMPGPGP